MERKKFKETAFGRLVCNKLPQVAGVVGELLPDKGVFGVVKNIIEKSTGISEADRAELLAGIDREMKELEMILSDKQSARSMQVEALKQTDVFSKRFIYYFAGASLILAFGYIFLVTFVNIPEGNQRLADTITGVVISTVVTTIFQFFFGSSKSSKDKTDIIDQLKKRG